MKVQFSSFGVVTGEERDELLVFVTYIYIIHNSWCVLGDVSIGESYRGIVDFEGVLD